MELGELYPAILTFVLVAILLGVGMTVLGNLATSSGVTAQASSAINTTITSIDDFVTWIPLLIVIIVASIILGLIFKSFRQ